MLGKFPNLTETFVVREINAILRQGFEVNIFAIKRPKLTKIEYSLIDSSIVNKCFYARPDNIFYHILINIKSLILYPNKYLNVLKLFISQLLFLPPIDFLKLLYHFFCGIGFTSKMTTIGINHIHCHFTSACNMGLAASLFLEIPFSWTAHASGDIFVNPILLKEKLKYARFVIAVCEYSKNYLDSITEFKHSHKIIRIYNGVNHLEPEEYLGCEFYQRKIRSSPNIFKIISVGNLLEPKGHATLIQACKLLRERGFNILCEIIGRGPQYDELLELIRKLRIEDSVNLRGPLSLKNIYKALANSDIFALLSQVGISGYRDGFPTVILEAMLMSLPIVSTWISGIPEMVVNGKTGLLVHERNYVAAADAIEKLIKNDEMRLTLGNNGKMLANRKFNLKDTSPRFADIILKEYQIIK
jgi:glycosyltransferase involved in cell wall biosynthesis